VSGAVGWVDMHAIFKSPLLVSFKGYKHLITDFPDLVEMDKAARTRRCCCAPWRFSSVL
jgi:hypothetical protein